MSDYVIEIETDEDLSDGELDELRQVVLDFITPSEGTTISVTQVD